MFEIQTGPGAELAVEPAAQTEPQNQTAGGPDDDLIIFMPVSVDIKREPQELALEWAKKCNPNVIIDLMDDEHSINVKTEVNDENLAPNRANAMERSIQRNVVTKKPQKPIVERCVGRICAPIKRPRLYEGTIANQGMDDGATDGADQSENEMVSDSEEEIISQAEGLRTYNELGIIDATDVDFVAIAFQDPATDIDVPAHRQQAGNSISNVSYCQQCGSFHASKNALRKHYTTKKHASKVLELVFETGRTNRNFSPVIAIQDPINRQHPAARDDLLLHCDVCNSDYSSKSTMTKHLKSKKHAENQIQEAEVNEID